MNTFVYEKYRNIDISSVRLAILGDMQQQFEWDKLLGPKARDAGSLKPHPNLFCAKKCRREKIIY